MMAAPPPASIHMASAVTLALQPLATHPVKNGRRNRLAFHQDHPYREVFLCNECLVTQS